jgi:steroid delta-isomerase-like uncharacterized protein
MFMSKVFHVILLFGLAVFLCGCSGVDDIAEQNKAVIISSMEVINNHEYEKYDQFFTLDFKRYSQATPDVQINSLEEMIGFVKQWDKAFPDANMEMKMMAAENDLVAVWVTYTGTHQAPMGEIPATGKRIESETFAFFRIEEGKIAESWVTWDNLAIMNQLDLLPPDSSE